MRGSDLGPLCLKKILDGFPMKTSASEDTKEQTETLHQGIYNLGMEIRHLQKQQ